MSGDAKLGPDWRRVRKRRQPRRTRPMVIGSVLWHAAVLGALLLLGVHRTPPPEQETAPAFDVVFESASSDHPSLASQDVPTDAASARTPPDTTPPAPEEVTPVEPPTPETTPPPAPPKVTPVEPPAPEPAPPEPAPPEPAPVEPTPVKPVVPQPSVVQPEPSPLPLPPAPTPPLPTPPVPPSVSAPRPRPPARPRPPVEGSLLAPAPFDLSFGSASSARAPRPKGSRGIDLSLGPPRAGPSSPAPFAEIRAAHATADWINSVAAYWARHKYYPSQAIQHGEDGTVEIQLMVNKYGRVESIDLTSRSGSQWLDLAALGTFRGAQLAPLPDEAHEDHRTVDLTLHYILIR